MIKSAQKSIFIKLTIVFVFCAVVPVLISFAFSNGKIGQANQQSVMAGNLEVAKAAARDVSNYFQNGITVLENLSAELEQLPLSSLEKDHLLKMNSVNHSYYQFLRLVDLDGKVLQSSEFNSPLKVDVSQVLPRFQHERLVISDLYIVSDVPPVRPAVSLYFPIRHEGQVQEILMAELDLTYAWHLVNQMKIGEHGETILLDAKGNVFASSNLALFFSLKSYPQYQDLFQNHQIQSHSFVQNLMSAGTFLVSVVPLKLPFGGALVVRQPVDEAFELSQRLANQMLFLLIGVAILMVVVGYWGVNRLILSPIKSLTQGLEKVAQGEWQQKLNLETGDEFQKMGEYYNDMTFQLTKQAEQIRRQERISMIGRLAGGLLHDLKHPISNIRNWTRLMPEKASDPKFVDDFTKVVDREFKNVDLFFMNLRDLTSGMPFTPSTFKIQKLLSELKRRFELAAEHKKIQIELSESDFDIKADYFLIMRVLSNLLDNAIQAVPEFGKVEIRVVSAQDRIDFVVSDNGPGIPSERLPSLFEDFSTTKRRGLGLGLAISKKIVELHGGEIAVESAVAMGTAFRFWLRK